MGNTTQKQRTAIDSNLLNPSTPEGEAMTHSLARIYLFSQFRRKGWTGEYTGLKNAYWVTHPNKLFRLWLYPRHVRMGRTWKLSESIHVDMRHEDIDEIIRIATTLAVDLPHLAGVNWYYGRCPDDRCPTRVSPQELYCHGCGKSVHPDLDNTKDQSNERAKP